MPRPRKLTEQQEDEAFARYQAAGGAYGTIGKLAREYELTWPGMKSIPLRAEQRAQNKVSRETLKLADAEELRE